MPMPVSTARQCLTEEAARSLDDAVAVARRRNHAQTTSLHAISALLALPSSTLRDACTRARSCSYSPRLQFRALELSVGVSLDRLPTSKTLDEDPPVSNSLMAAIKRSQANQRRHPDSFHLLQMHTQQSQSSSSFLKVELKHFILSILDDPIVSRVFGEASFRSSDIKLALLQPPMSQAASRFSRSRYPPIVLCNLETGRPGLNFPFTWGNPVSEDSGVNCKRIADVLARKNKRNPLLMGVYAKGALRSFTELVQRGSGGVSFPDEIAGLSVISFEKEISEFLVEHRSESEEKMGLKFKELSLAVEQCSGPGIAVNFGELEAFVGDGVPVSAASFVVSQLTKLLKIHGEKFWLLGMTGTDAYSKFIALFPNVDNDWDLHLLTMTSAIPSMEGLYSKSSLMGSFVPFGGFFSTPSDFKIPVRCTYASLSRCDTCNEKYEQEVADILKVGPATSTSGYSTSLPWLQKVNVDTDRGLDVAKTNEENTRLNAKVSGLQKKWSDICQHLHHTRSVPEFDIPQTRSPAPSVKGFQFGSDFKESSSKDSSLNEFQCSDQLSYLSKESQSIFSSKQKSPISVAFDTISINMEAGHKPNIAKSQQINTQNPWVAPCDKGNMTLLENSSSSSHIPVTTDLRLGTIYVSAAQEPITPKLLDQKLHFQHSSDSLSTDFDVANETNSHQIARTSFCFGPNLEGKFDSLDFKSLNQRLIEKVGRQEEAIYAISQTVSRCKSSAGKCSGSHVRADIWLAFLGPDRLGKMKIASALADIIFGNSESLISVDLSSQDRLYPSNSIFEFRKLPFHSVLRRKTVMDYIAGELNKNPRSVVLLENVDKADFLVQTSLFQAKRTGKFPYSLGREISINNAIFIVASTVSQGNGSFVLEECKLFSEERILEAKRCQMHLLLEHTSKDAKRTGSTNVMVAPRKGPSKPTFLNKRKLVESSDSKEQAICKIPKQAREASRSYLDLNMPLDEVEEGIKHNDDESESKVENSEAWFDDFCGLVDEKVVFKPFNFDSLAEQILKSIDILFHRTFGSEFLMEVDYWVMTQILAAAWLSDKKNAVDDWIEHVLGRVFAEARQKYHTTSQYFHVVKLVSCESNFVEEQASGVSLPARINLD